MHAADEIEGMPAAQAMAAHHTSMEFSRRAMFHEQPFEAVVELYAARWPDPDEFRQAPVRRFRNLRHCQRGHPAT
jgi:hypothetical protein